VSLSSIPICTSVALSVSAMTVLALPARAATAPAVPASYAGDLPAASGTVRLHVDLLPGGRYQLRRTFVDRPEPGNRFDDIGRWRFEAASSRVVLRGGREGTLYFQPAGRDLRKLDTRGRRIVSASGHNDLLTRLPQPAPIEPRLPLTGMFTYMADAPRIVLCANGQSLPVAQEGAYLPLERAYTEARGMGRPILAQLKGTITRRVGGEESLGPLPALVVERFERLWPGKTCRSRLPAAASVAAAGAAAGATPAPPADLALRGTTWNLVQLSGKPVAPLPNGRRAHLVLDPAAPQLSGHGGCNRLMGGFESNGSALRFTGVGGTRMACEPEVMATEYGLLQALSKVAAWTVRGDELELVDAGGVVLARFSAQPATTSPATSVPPLRGTPWTLTQLAGQAVGTPAPDLLLDATQSQYSGSGGCNRLVGGFETSGTTLRFKGGASTMMACEQEVMAREQALNQALEQTASFRQTGATLELLDAQGRLLARFTAARR
jgi:copper homeostasis protein (lipoprotein)